MTQIETIIKHAYSAAEIAIELGQEVDQFYDFYTDCIDAIGIFYRGVNPRYARSLFNRVAWDEYTRLTAPITEDTCTP